MLNKGVAFSMFNKGVDLANAYPPVVDKPASIYGFQTHNLYKDYPPMMSDGRVISASWQPEAVVNNNLVKSAGLTSNWQYRQYLIEHGNKLIAQNRVETMNDIGYIARYAKSPETPYTPPYKYKSYLDNTTVFGYENSDLKHIYFSKEELNARKVAPVITQYELISKSQPMA